MPERHEPLEETLRRLKAERDEADRRYNDALTALDRPIGAGLRYPDPPPPYDEHQLAALNEAWNILPVMPGGSGLKSRLTRFVWHIVAPYFQRQLTFNSRLVDHLNRNAPVYRDGPRVAEATIALVRDEIAALADFHSRLMQYLQQITAYVDTKDRDSAGGALVLNAALGAMAENLAKRWESMTARDQRYEARTSALAAEQQEIRALAKLAQQTALTLKRELERLAIPKVQEVQEVQEVQKVRKVREVQEVQQARDREAFTTPLDAYKYVGFEDQFRGSSDAIRARLESYLPFFSYTEAHRGTQKGVTEGDVLDVGCGRGEFLDLLKAHGISARGIDLNHEMAEGCRARGLDVTEADAVGYLSSVPDGSLAGIFAAQVVEHLEPGYLLRFLDLAYHKVRPGGRLVLETLNPACWVAFFESYIRDITHVWPLHPETLKYLVVASGFSKASVEFRSPVPRQDRLQPVAAPAGSDPAFADLAEAFNANVEKLNARIFTYLDYAVVGER